MDTLLDIRQTQIRGAINSAINDRVIPEIQKIMGSLSLDRNDTELVTSLDEDGVGNVWINAMAKFTKNDSRTACDLRQDADFTPYKYKSN